MIEFQRVSKTFADPRGGEVLAVRDLDLVIQDGETHGLVGTSGCGKTTTMRMINRLEEPTSGRVLVGGQDVATIDVIALRRRIGYVIQQGGLFPHFTVARNVGILCELEGQPPAAIQERVDHLLQLVGLPPGEFRDRRPGELSGGQAQRVGIARALALDPDHVLMDEPFGALDPITRAQIHEELAPVFREVHKTVVLVTHDLAEAFALADRISVMHQGRILQTGTPAALAAAPADEFVERFLAGHVGDGNGKGSRRAAR